MVAPSKRKSGSPMSQVRRVVTGRAPGRVSQLPGLRDAPLQEWEAVRHRRRMPCKIE